MSLREKFLSWFGGGAAKAAPSSGRLQPAPNPIRGRRGLDRAASSSSEVTHPLREAAGTTIDDDEDQWRRLTGDANRDLAPLTQARMQKIAAWLWESNPLANRLIELPVAYLLAEGVSLSCEDAEHQKILDRFWRDPINAFALKLPEKVRELALFGEQCWPAFVNEHDGMVRLGYLDPSLVETVVTDPDNASQPIGIVTVKDRKGRARRYRVIVNGPEDVFTARTRQIRETFADGDAFYYRVNNLAAGRRGRSDLLHQADWMDGYDQFLFGELDRAKFLRAFFWDVTLTNATEDQVLARSRQISAPPPGAVRVHNDSEQWKAEAPQLHAAESAEHARLFRNHILGGASMPEHWFGGGGDVNRAAASEMGEPTFKIYSMRQGLWKLILEDMGRYVLRQAAMAAGEAEPDWEDERWEVEAVFPELTARDTSRWAAALQQVTAAVAVAVERGLLTEQTAVQIIAAIAGRLGVEIDPAEELKQAQEEAAKRREADAFQEPEIEGQDAPASAAGSAPTAPNDRSAQEAAP